MIGSQRNQGSTKPVKYKDSSLTICRSQNWSEWVHPRDQGKKYTLGLVGAGDLESQDLDACFNLIDQTSGEDYRKSSVGWHPAAKKKEMRSPDLRYILVKDSDGAISGFTSMMPTFENGEPVVYCYEIHLKPELQGLVNVNRNGTLALSDTRIRADHCLDVLARTGLGKRLMGYLVEAAESMPSVQKVMLTCFVCNDKARMFYEKLGFGVDEFSPRERKLRGGKTVIPDHIIMSRRTRTTTPRKRSKEGSKSTTLEEMPNDKQCLV